MRSALTILAGVVIACALRYFLPPANAASRTVHEEPVVSGVTAPVEKTDVPANPAYQEPDIYCRGYIVKGGRANVLLSDGTTWTEERQGDLAIFRHYVVFRGKMYPLRIPERIAKAEPPPGLLPSPAALAGDRAAEPRSLLLDTTAADLDAAANRNK